ncbi:MAG: YerC/YecD family TrpR-related protein [Patescibacteria group bacterium]
MVDKKEKWINEDSDNLFRAVLALRNTEEARRFFRDLLTENEILEFARRWKAARLLASGVPYREIGRQTWLSPRTIARVHKWLEHGKGGYRLILERTGKGR